MNKKILGLALAATFTVSTANAAVIDNFDSGLLSFPGLFATGPSGTANASQVGSMIGGNRTMSLGMLAGTGTSIVTVINPGVLDINNGVNERSDVTISWDFSSNDFTDGGLSTGIFLSLPSPTDNIMNILFSLDDGTNISTINQFFLDGSSGGDFFLAFSDFSGSADLTALTSASIAISSPDTGLDVQIDLIETRPVPSVSVPEPASLALLGLGLGLMGVARRNKKA